jgi:hypothetical protein
MFKKHLEGMSYVTHFVKNMNVVGLCFKAILIEIAAVMFHSAHAIFPCGLTDHHYWGLGKYWGLEKSDSDEVKPEVKVTSGDDEPISLARIGAVMLMLIGAAWVGLLVARLTNEFNGRVFPNSYVSMETVRKLTDEHYDKYLVSRFEASVLKDEVRELQKQLQKEKELNDVISDIASDAENKVKELREKYENPRGADKRDM